jgi:uncharacterized membrane protein
MDEQPMQQIPPPTTGTDWQQAPPPPPNYQAAAVAPAEGLSDTAAGALAYVTIIPAIIFLVMAPYNTKPFIRFHSFQCIGLAICWFCLGLVWVVPILGWIVGALGFLTLLVCWIMSIVKASQGSYFKLPVISEFASKQSGYPI